MVAAATLLVALLAAASQAVASSHNAHGRSLHDASHHHHVAVARDYVSPNLAGPLAKRHEANKKRTNVKRARRCKPKPKSTSTKKAAPTQNTAVKDKDDDPEPPKPTHKADPPKADPPKASPPKHNSSNDDDDDPPANHPKTGVFATHTGGDGTFYAPGLNACGFVDKSTDFIAAAAFGMFDNFPGATDNPNNNPICRRKVRATYNGNSVTVAITDRCAGCTNPNSLDFSPSAFKELADFDVGRFHNLEWEFI